MRRPILYSVCALTIALLVSLPNQAFAISHGCTNPPGLKNIKISLDLGGTRSSASGQLCSAIQQAAALVDRSLMSTEAKAAARQKLNMIQAQASSAKPGTTLTVELTCGRQGCKWEDVVDSTVAHDDWKMDDGS